MSRWSKGADDFPSQMSALSRRIRNLKMLWLALIAGEPGPVLLTAARGHVRPMPERMKWLTLFTACGTVYRPVNKRIFSKINLNSYWKSIFLLNRAKCNIQ